MRLPCVLICAFSLFLASSTFAQERVTTIGIQLKPILSSSIINTGPQNQEIEDINYTITPKSGYAFGMVIKKVLQNRFRWKRESIIQERALI